MHHQDTEFTEKYLVIIYSSDLWITSVHEQGEAMAETSACKRGKLKSHKTSSLPWGVLRKIFSCKDPFEEEGKRMKKSKKINGSSLSVCSMRHSPTSVVSPETDNVVEVCNASGRYLRSPSAVPTPFSSSSLSSQYSSASIAASAVSSSSLGGSSRGMHLRKLSGCYECQVMVDPISGPYKVPSSRTNFCPCPECDEVFLRAESLELHQTVKHAVSELAPEDASRNIIELIFYSSWIKNQTPSCKIDRILKVHNSHRAITKFEEYRESIKIKANKHNARKHPRCVADGNELLRFCSTTLACSLGLHGSTSLCQSSNKQCGVCSIIRDGFKVDEERRIRTMATSGRAHGMAHISSDGGKRVMIVCRVIAGRVKKSEDGVGEYDSVADAAETWSNLDELFVFNPGAILPCFVVVYTSF